MKQNGHQRRGRRQRQFRQTEARPHSHYQRDSNTPTYTPSFEKLNFLGAELKLVEGHRIWLVLELLWFYWLLRYFQAFNAKREQPVSKHFAMLFERYMRKMAEKRFAKFEKEQTEPGRTVSSVIAEQLVMPFKSRIVWKRSGKFDNGEARQLPDYGFRATSAENAWVITKAATRLTFLDLEGTQFVLPPMYALVPLVVAIWQHVHH